MKIKRAGIFTKAVILALILYAAISLVSLNQSIMVGRAQKAKLEEDIAVLKRENAELEYELEHSGDRETIENIARSKLGLVMPGEKIFYDISQ